MKTISLNTFLLIILNNKRNLNLFSGRWIIKSINQKYCDPRKKMFYCWLVIRQSNRVNYWSSRFTHTKCGDKMIDGYLDTSVLVCTPTNRYVRIKNVWLWPRSNISLASGLNKLGVIDAYKVCVCVCRDPSHRSPHQNLHPQWLIDLCAFDWCVCVCVHIRSNKL